MATAKKETITPPSKKDVREAAKSLPKGGPARGPDGRVLAETGVSKRQGATRPKR